VTGREPAVARFRRLLVMLPWLAGRGTVATSEMAERFGISVTQLVADLELAAMCGVPPFLADELLDIIVDEDEVTLGVPKFFIEPLRFTAAEALAVAMGARAALGLPGAEPDGPLARAVAKLDAQLGTGEIEVELPGSELVELCVDAATNGDVLAIAYFSVHADRATEREVEPQLVIADRGHWYLSAFDRSADAVRSFRIDRIVHAARTGGSFVPVTAPELPDWLRADGGSAAKVVLDLDVADEWVVGRYPGARLLEEDAERIRVELSVYDPNWLRRLLLRLGSSARVVEPDHWQRLGTESAAALLDRYA
jgi:proteasome accessory factor C